MLMFYRKIVFSVELIIDYVKKYYYIFYYVSSINIDIYSFFYN